jgi:site-specific DNA recombinase
LEGKALAGQPTGGKAYGYIAARDSGTGSIEVNKTEAAVVRRIFEMYVSGTSPRAIAARLNKEGVPSPGSTWKRASRRRSGWLASAIHGQPERGSGILNNCRYIGLVVWGRTNGVAAPQIPPSDAVSMNDSDPLQESMDERLRIVSRDLWQRVKARQGRQRATIGARVKGGMRRNAPGQGRPPRHVLSGLLRCGLCDAGMTMADDRAYVCASHKNGAACTNSIRVARTLAETRILTSVKHDLRDPAFVAEVERAFGLALAARTRLQKSGQSAARISELEREIGNLADAVAFGLLRTSPALAQRLAAAEAELAPLKLARQPRAEVIARITSRLDDRVLTMVGELEARLGRDPERSRLALIEAIGDRIVLSPDVSRRFLWAEYGLQGERVLASLGPRDKW